MKARVIITLIVILFSTVLMAQPGDPNVDTDVPISGIEILLAAGGLAGLRKWYVSRKKSN